MARNIQVANPFGSCLLFDRNGPILTAKGNLTDRYHRPSADIEDVGGN
jgi:hypothetical protein